MIEKSTETKKHFQLDKKNTLTRRCFLTNYNLVDNIIVLQLDQLPLYL